MANNFYVEPANPFQALMSGVQGYGAGQQRLKDAALAEAGQLYAAGDLKGAQAAAARGGSFQALLGLAGLANQDRDFTFRQTEASRAQSNTDRGFGLQEKQFVAGRSDAGTDRALRQAQFSEQQRQFNVGMEGQKVPPGFERVAGGGVRPVQGGPQDPAYIEAVRKPPQMSVGDVTKLSDEGGKFANLTGFIDTFNPDYAGRPFKTGEISNYLARNLPEGMTGDLEKKSATWWQSYDRYKNVVRNDLFGSALTATEQAAFEKADINPGMNATAIKENLRIQKEIAERGIRRKAGALIQAGHDPKVISTAFGVPFGKPGTATAQTAQPPQTPAQVVDWRTYFGGGGQ